MNRVVQALRSWTFGLFILAIFAFASSAPHIARAYEGPMWPPDRAVFDRLQASADFEDALDYLIAVISQAPAHAGERGFLRLACPLGHMSAMSADATGSHLGLIESVDPLLKSHSRNARAMGHLVAGAVYCAGTHEFPTWKDAAKKHLQSVVTLAPFSAAASAAREIGVAYGVKVSAAPWYGYAIAALLPVLILAAIWGSARRPRLRGNISVTGHGGGLEMYNLGSAGKGRYVVIYIDGDSVRFARARGALSSFVKKVDKIASKGEGMPILAFFPAARSKLRVWARDGGQIVVGRDSRYFSSEDVIDRDCEIRVLNVSVRIDGFSPGPIG